MKNLDTAMHENKALKLWEEMSQSERTGVRFGLLPSKAMLDAVAEGYDTQILSSCVFKVAKSKGGMVA